MSIRTVKPGETGLDFSYTKPPPKLVKELGHTFVAGYSSFNPGKNCLNPQAYIDEGLAYIDLWEVTQTRCDGGFSQGSLDGIEEGKQAKAKGVPPGVAVVACCDTNSVPNTINAHSLYMQGFGLNNPLYGLGGYIDTDLASRVPFDLAILPSAWYWSNPISKLPNETQAEYYKRGQEGAEFKAKVLGYHLLQRSSFKINNLYSVDPLFCIREFQAWGNPLTQEEPMTPYVFQLDNGGFGIRHESGSRSINDGELAGPYKSEVVYKIPKGSNWEAWVLMELAKYENDLNPSSAPVGHFPSQIELDITSVPGKASGTLS